MPVSLLKGKRFNKNIHTKNPFITLGLLTSRNTKNNTNKISIAEPNVVNIQKYKQFKSIDSHVLRDTKKRRRRKIHPNTKGLL